MHPKYKRIMLKISGEALSGEYGFGLDDKILQSIAKQLSEVVTLGVEIAMVVGGGNIWRGLAGMGKGIDRVSSDNMGMLATTINSLALQAVMEQNNIQTRVQTAIEMKAFAEPYIRRRAIRHLEKGRVVIFAAGTGNPYFSTDTSAALRAAEIEAEVILMAKKVDGVYDSDPMTNSKAARYVKLSYLDILNENLKVMDSTAVSLCKDNNIPIVVFDLTKPGNILKAVVGEEIGTVIGGAYYAK